jgi:hypothetical protein
MSEPSIIALPWPEGMSAEDYCNQLHRAGTTAMSQLGNRTAERFDREFWKAFTDDGTHQETATVEART